MTIFSCVKVVMRLEHLGTDVTFAPIVAIDQTRGSVFNVSYFDRQLCTSEERKSGNMLDFKEAGTRN